MSGGYMALGREEVTPVESFDFVFGAHHDYVYSLTHALLGNDQDAEDVTQEVFLRVYKALPSYNPELAGMRTWLARVAVNACQTHRRRNFLSSLLRHSTDGNGDLLEAIDGSLWGAPEDHALQVELRQTVKDVLAKLRPEHRTIIVLHYYMDFSCLEIARIVGCPEGTVYSRLHYARRIVQAQLERRISPPSPTGSEVI